MAAICFMVVRAVLLATDSEMWPELTKSCVRNSTGPWTAWADWFTITLSGATSVPSAPYITFHGRTADTKADASWTPSPPYKTGLGEKKACDHVLLQNKHILYAQNITWQFNCFKLANFQTIWRQQPGSPVNGLNNNENLRLKLVSPLMA